jgi:hypothetical protein
MQERSCFAEERHRTDGHEAGIKNKLKRICGRSVGKSTHDHLKKMGRHFDLSGGPNPFSLKQTTFQCETSFCNQTE